MDNATMKQGCREPFKPFPYDYNAPKFLEYRIKEFRACFRIGLAEVIPLYMKESDIFKGIEIIKELQRVMHGEVKYPCRYCKY